jgi:uncharacterized protein YaiI (UPF0178 family)
MRLPEGVRATLEVVDKGMNAADDWIVRHVEANDIVITADIPLAARCVEKGAHVGEIGTGIIKRSGKFFCRFFFQSNLSTFCEGIKLRPL